MLTKKKNKHITANDYTRFEKLAALCIESENGFTFGIQNPDGELLASAFFGMDEKRIYYILGSPNQEGRETGAVHSLIDEIIKKFAGSGLVFDFEGSDITSVSQFYSKFNPARVQYDILQTNRLPTWIQKLRAKWRSFSAG